MTVRYEDIKDAEGTAIVLCAPTSEPHVELSIIKQCDFCGADVWLSQATRNTKATVPEERYLMCLKCAAANRITETEVLQMPTDDQLREVAAHVGISFEEAKAKAVRMVTAQNQAAKYESN